MHHVQIDVLTIRSIDLWPLALVLELLSWDVLQAEGSDRSILVLLLVGHVSDEQGDVLFQLSQVLSDIILVESGSVVVLHVLCNGQEEVGKSEVLDHGLNSHLDLAQLTLDVGNLVLLIGYLSRPLLDFLHELLADNLFLLLGHLTNLLVVLDLNLDVVVLLLDHIDFRVEHVHIVVK